jgi:hypothetical protein
MWPGHFCCLKQACRPLTKNTLCLIHDPQWPRVVDQEAALHSINCSMIHMTDMYVCAAQLTSGSVMGTRLYREASRYRGGGRAACWGLGGSLRRTIQQDLLRSWWQ